MRNRNTKMFSENGARKESSSVSFQIRLSRNALTFLIISVSFGVFLGVPGDGQAAPSASGISLDDIRNACKKRQNVISANTIEANLTECRIKDSKKPVPARYFTLCMADVLEEFSEISEPACRDLLRPKLRELYLAPLVERFKSLDRGDGVQFNQVQLEAAFDHLKKWSENLEGQFYGGAVDDYENDLMSVGTAFWERVWAVYREDSATSLLKEQQSFTTHLPVFTQILEAAEKIHLEKVPFYVLAAMGLIELDQRSETFTSLAKFIHELTLSPVESDLLSFSKTMVKLDHLEKNLSGSKNFGQEIQNVDLRNFMTSLAHHGPSDTKFLQEFGLSHTKLSAVPADILPPLSRPYFETLATLIVRANEYIASYGVSSASVNPVEGISKLRMGFTEHNIGMLPDDLEQLRTTLSKDIAQLEKNRGDMLANLKIMNNETSEKDRLEMQLKDLEDEQKHLEADIKGLQATLMREERLISQASQRFIELTSTEGWARSFGQKPIEVEKNQLSINDQSIKFVFGSRPLQSLTAIAVQPNPIHVRKGETLSFSVLGRWAPSCALQKEGFPSGAVTGPEGFMEVVNNDRASIESVTNSETLRTFNLIQNTAGVENRSAISRTERHATQWGNSFRNSLSSSSASVYSTKQMRSVAKSMTNSRKLERPFETIDDSFLGIHGDQLVRYAPIKIDASTYGGENFSFVENSSSHFDVVNSHVGAAVNAFDSETTHGKDISEVVGRSEQHGHEQAKGRESGKAENLSNSDTVEDRISASFSLGLRSSFTPFYEFPMGSLLLIQLKKGTNSLKGLLDIQVMRPDTIVIVNEDSDFYLVVNDCTAQNLSQAPSSNKGALTVNYAVLSTAEKESTNAIKLIEKAISHLKKKASGFVETGEFTSLQARALEADAHAFIALNGASLRSLDLIKDLFDSWIASELIRIELQTKIIQARRRQPPLLRRLAQLKNDIRRVNQHIKLSSISQIWSADNFDIYNLGTSVRNTTQTLAEFAIPIMKVRYSPVLGELSRTEASWVAGLGVNSSLLEVAQKLETLLEKMRKGVLNQAKYNNNRAQMIALRFPKPGLNGESGCLNVNGGCPIASSGSAAAVWQAIENASIQLETIPTVAERAKIRQGSFATFEVSPKNIYVADVEVDPETLLNIVPSTSEGSLGTCDVLPIAESMALYFSVPDMELGSDLGSMNDEARIVELQIVSDLFFPKAPKLGKGYRFRPVGQWSSVRVPVYFGKESTPKAVFKKMESLGVLDGQGISPFGKFQLDFRKLNLDIPSRPLYAVVKHASEVTLVFKVSCLHK